MGGRPGYLWDADIERATREYELSPVLERHGTWAVTLFGVECLTDAYWVEYDRLGESDWPDHMRMKGWVVWPDFMSALESARRLVAKGKTRRRFLILRRDGYRCQLCGAKASDGVQLEIDHKHPKSRGGKDDPENLWTLCRECNQGKSDLSL